MSSFGRVFRVTTYGESHSKAVGCIVEGMPAGIRIKKEDIQFHLDRRRPGQSSITTSRKELDQVEVVSGIEGEITLGTPVMLMVKNEDFKVGDYKEFKAVPRPGHADFTYLTKYGLNSESGGGRASARETIARVAAGALAQSYLGRKEQVKITAFVSSVGTESIAKEKLQEIIECEKLSAEFVDSMGTFYYLKNSGEENPQYWNPHTGNLYQKDGSIIAKVGPEILDKYEKTAVEQINVRCPHPDTAVKIIESIKEVKSQNDSLGGIITCVCKGVPAGLGEPCFDKLEAMLAHAMLSIPSTKGFEIGSGFEGTKLRGSQHNDPFVKRVDNEEVSLMKKLAPLMTKSNNAGGTLGGISSGSDIVFKIAFKPVSTIGLPQKTCDIEGEEAILEAKGRHDPCILPRAPAIVEAMAALVLMDAYLIQTINLNAGERLMK